MNLIVHINGWPGCGKLTIARILARQLGAKLLDNHTLLNPAEILFERADPLHASLRKEIRASVLDHAARMQADVPLIFTDALSDDAADSALFGEYRTLAAHRGARLVAVVLDCAEDENVRRMASPGRSELHKLTRPEILTGMRSNYRLLRPDGLDRIDLDITTLSADAAATATAEALPAPTDR